MQPSSKPVLALVAAALTAAIAAGTQAKESPRKAPAVPGLAANEAATPGTAEGTPSPASAALTDIEKTLGFVPRFFTEIPAAVLPGTWDEMKNLQMSDKTALPPKVKELIGLGVSSQIPCQYCIQAHREFARADGATEAEIGDAVAMAALTRHWSTYMNGIQLDEKRFRSDLSRMVQKSRKDMQAGTPPPAPMAVTDDASALADIRRSIGFVPEFLERFPAAARPGAWKAMRDVELNPNSALNGKYKSLVGLAVSSQIPCHYCIQADKEFSKLDGATDAEINEAVAMASFTRHMSTLLNGMKVDEGQFASDVSRMVKGAQASRAAPQESPTRTR